MTAKNNFKRIVRRRMQNTGESYMAARRHFLNSKDFNMTKRADISSNALLGLPIERLQFTLKTTQTLKANGLQHIGQLVNRSSPLVGLDSEGEIELKEVLASRGLQAGL